MAYRQIVALAENENAAKVVAMTASSIGAGIHAQVNAIHPSPRYTPDAQVQPYFSSEQIDQLRQQSENIAAAAKSEFAVSYHRETVPGIGVNTLLRVIRIFIPSEHSH